jgi:hypothetical protein
MIKMNFFKYAIPKVVTLHSKRIDALKLYSLFPRRVLLIITLEEIASENQKRCIGLHTAISSTSHHFQHNSSL